MIIEIEDYYGNTLCAFEVKNNKVNIGRSSNCDIADYDEDYIFNTKQQLIRIQLEQNMDCADCRFYIPFASGCACKLYPEKCIYE